MTIEEAYTITPLTAANLSRLKPLFKNAFGTEVRDEVLTQRFSTERLGLPVVGFIAVDKGTEEVAAYYGVFPVKLLVEGNAVLAAQSGDTMTHTGHHKKGLFIYLAQRTFDACRELGIAYIFGMPNANSYHGFTQKLSWTCIDHISQYDIKRRWKTIPYRRVFFALGKGHLFQHWVEKRLAKYIVSAPADFTTKGLGNGPRILRDDHYIDYKMGSDKYFLSVGGLKVWVKLSDTFWIGAFDDYEKLTVQVIEQLKTIAFRLGYNTIRFHCNENFDAPFLKEFTKSSTEPLCSYALQPEYQNLRPSITAADFDTW